MFMEWLLDVGFPDGHSEADSSEDEGVLASPASVVEEAVRGVLPGCLSSSPIRPLAGGFCADLHVAELRDGRSVVVKQLQLEHLAMQLATTPSQIQRNFELASSLDVGPRTYGLANNCLVMDLVAGHHPGLEDMSDQVVSRFAFITRKLHDSVAVEGTPLVWKWMNCMAAFVGDGASSLSTVDQGFVDAVLAEVRDIRDTLDQLDLLIGFCHGNLKPLNVMVHGCDVQLIDFDASGCNYRGYDLMKFFRKDEPFGDALFEHFLEEYSGGSWPVDRLVREARICEPLTYLEPAIFFLFLAVKESENCSQWIEKARWRFSQYKESIAAAGLSAM
mmetsp:Transcript_122599/g.281010  ORF Transcript_122599/g.281010 Transcript_122599/m.281010 type:complete len:332 (+) Transcript_122599:2409-3404(+)